MQYYTMVYTDSWNDHEYCMLITESANLKNLEGRAFVKITDYAIPRHTEVLCVVYVTVS